MWFVYDFGGRIARRNGKWVGALNSPQAHRGAGRVEGFFLAPPARTRPATRRARSRRRVRPGPGRRRSSARRGSRCCVGKKHTADGAVPDAEPHQGQGRCRASSAAPTSRSRDEHEKSLAADWIAAFTSTTTERRCRRRATSRTRPTARQERQRAGALRGAGSSRRPELGDVENGNILRTMLARILTGRATSSRPPRRRATTSPTPSTSVAAESNGSELQPSQASPPRPRPARRRRRAVPASRRLGPVPAAAAGAGVIVAVLGYPLYRLVRLSFQRYGLFELIRHQGDLGRPDNYAPVLHDGTFWDVLLARSSSRSPTSA